MASSLDAFSSYHIPTWLPNDALGRTIGTPVVGSSRSSRTRDKSLQLSYAHGRWDRTVSRRSEPSSRTALNGEQPYPWDRLQPQDAMSRHRGAKPPRRCLSSWGRSARLSPAYLYPLSDGPSTHNHRITMTDFRLCSTCRSHSQASLCHYTQQAISIRFELTFVSLRYYLGRRPPQSNYPPDIVLNEDNSSQLSNSNIQGWYLKDGSDSTCV